LICPFCSQWNPENAVRCVFCRNPPDATEDQTVSGRLRLTAEQVAKIPEAPRGFLDGPAKQPEWVRKLQTADKVTFPLWAVLMAAGALLMLIGFFRFCR